MQAEGTRSQRLYNHAHAAQREVTRDRKGATNPLLTVQIWSKCSDPVKADGNMSQSVKGTRCPGISNKVFRYS